MRGTRALLAAAAVSLALMPALPALAAVTATPPPDPFAGEPWWVPVGLRGTRVEGPLLAEGGSLEVTTPEGRLRSGDGGRTWAPAGPVPAGNGCTAAGAWQICGGRVLHDGVPDPGSPDLGAAAHLLGAPGILDGVVVTVAADGTVWRRSRAGDWGRALLLLPDSALDPHVPAVTGVAAFTQPLSNAVYVATDGYAVLESSNGGDDWIRAGPGLPGHVLALTADDAARAVYAATDDGLWVHHLQATPRPPDYAPQDLRSRQLGTALVTLAGCAAAVLGLWRLVARRG